MKFKTILRKDFGRYNDWKKIPDGVFKTYIFYPGFKFTFWLRLAQWAHARRLGVLAKVATLIVLYYSERTGIQINVGAKIGEGLYIPHFGGIVVNPSAQIGKNCYLSHNVLIGAVFSGKRKGVPCIGDNVFIGTGAVLLGNITVGENAAIGVNSVVIDDVPANTMVAGAPAKVVSDRGAAYVLGQDNPNMNGYAT